jgi:hypothetical protein
MPFETETIPSISFLAELREEVLKHSLKRMPKWKFRFAPDIVVQLQPQPTLLLSAAATERGLKPKHQHFIGTAVMMEGVTADVFKRLPQRLCPPWWQTKFEIYAHDPSADADWFVHQTSGRWQHRAGRPGWVTLFERTVAILRSGFFTASMPAQMLSYNCVICGKGLTDPASMARWIGPECAGTSTLHVPFVIAPQLNEAAA